MCQQYALHLAISLSYIDKYTGAYVYVFVELSIGLPKVVGCNPFCARFAAVLRHSVPAYVPRCCGVASFKAVVHTV